VPTADAVFLTGDATRCSEAKCLVTA